jgi:hypothetical protein
LENCDTIKTQKKRGINMEEKYWELREMMDRAWDNYMREPDAYFKLEYDSAYDEFADLCIKILEKLMEENSDILERLK